MKLKFPAVLSICALGEILPSGVKCHPPQSVTAQFSLSINNDRKQKRMGHKFQFTLQV